MSFGSDLAERHTLPFSTGVRTDRPRIGSVATTATLFGTMLGLAGSQRTLLRRSMVGSTGGAATDGLAVRPPIDWWPWPDDTADESTDGPRRRDTTTSAAPVRRAVAAAPDDFVPTGDRKLDALRKMMGARNTPGASPTASSAAAPSAPASSGAPTTTATGGVGPTHNGPRRAVRRPAVPIRRGLPRASARRGHTAAGAGTAPGAISTQLTPDTIVPTTPATRPASNTGTSRSRASQGPDDAVERLRRSLQQSGRLPSPTETTTAPRSTPTGSIPMTPSAASFAQRETATRPARRPTTDTGTDAEAEFLPSLPPEGRSSDPTSTTTGAPSSTPASTHLGTPAGTTAGVSAPTGATPAATTPPARRRDSSSEPLVRHTVLRRTLAPVESSDHERSLPRAVAPLPAASDAPGPADTTGSWDRAVRPDPTSRGNSSTSPDTPRPDTPRPDTPRSDTPRSDTSRPDTSRPDAARPTASPADGPRDTPAVKSLPVQRSLPGVPSATFLHEETTAAASAPSSADDRTTTARFKPRPRTDPPTGAESDVARGVAGAPVAAHRPGTPLAGPRSDTPRATEPAVRPTPAVDEARRSTDRDTATAAVTASPPDVPEVPDTARLPVRPAFTVVETAPGRSPATTDRQNDRQTSGGTSRPTATREGDAGGTSERSPSPTAPAHRGDDRPAARTTVVRRAHRAPAVSTAPSSDEPSPIRPDTPSPRTVPVDDLAVRPPAAETSLSEVTPPWAADTVRRSDDGAHREPADRAERPRFDVEPAAPLADVAAATLRPTGTRAAPDGEPSRGHTDEPVVRRSTEDVGSLFLAELGRHRRQAPAPLPTRLRPLADVIARHRTVRVSTDTASQRALEAVGKRAATTGDVIHLSRRPTSRADDAVVAHELTHVAHPSPLPRFFDDHRPSPEETRAEQVAAIIRRSPVLPRSSAASEVRRTPAPPVSGFGSRRPADTAPAPAGGGISADTLARQLGFDVGSAPSTSATTVRRALGTSFPTTAERDPSPSPSSGSRHDESSSQNSDNGSGGYAFPFDLKTIVGTRDFVQWLAENLGDRIIRDLELRGGRIRGGA